VPPDLAGDQAADRVPGGVREERDRAEELAPRDRKTIVAPVATPWRVIGTTIRQSTRRCAALSTTPGLLHLSSPARIEIDNIIGLGDGQESPVA
jgi:hypothetical protein